LPNKICRNSPSLLQAGGKRGPDFIPNFVQDGPEFSPIPWYATTNVVNIKLNMGGRFCTQKNDQKGFEAKPEKWRQRKPPRKCEQKIPQNKNVENFQKLGWHTSISVFREERGLEKRFAKPPGGVRLA